MLLLLLRDIAVPVGRGGLVEAGWRIRHGGGEGRKNASSGIGVTRGRVMIRFVEME